MKSRIIFKSLSLFVAINCFLLPAHSTWAFLNVGDLIVIAASDVPTGSAATPDIPMGQSGGQQPSLLPEDAEVTEDDLFGIRGGYLHPYLSLSGEYTDNLFNVSEDTTSNFMTRISPGIWFSLPRTKEIPVTITPHNTSPGGLQLQLDDYQGTDRYRAYALAGLDYKAYSEDSDLNDTDARLEGLFRYNMRGGLSLQALDRFTYGQDRFEAGSASRNNLRRFTTNIFMGTVDYLVTEKLRLKGDYTHFLVDYDDDINAFLDRVDNSLELYGYYNYSPKTSIFLQYRFTDVSYDTTEEKDSTQNYGYIGLSWDTTEKLSTQFKLGYQERNFEDDTIADQYDWDGFTFDLQTTYYWTEKTTFTLDMYRRSEESDSAVAISKIVLGALFRYEQQYTEKFGGTLDFIYENADYDQIVATERDDTRYLFRPALQYLFREWMMLELAYMYDKRDSTDNLFDYNTNTIIFSINLAM